MFGKSMEIDNDSFFDEYWNEEIKLLLYLLNHLYYFRLKYHN